MSNWNDLPVVILTMIFRNLGPSQNSVQCQLTCKAWRRPAQKIGFENVELTQPEQFEKFINTLVDTGLGFVVEKISLQFQSEQTEHLDKIASLCPNLKELKNNYCYDVLYGTIEKGKANNHFSKLTKLSPPKEFDDVSLVNRYNSIALSLQDSLQEILVIEETNCQGIQEIREKLSSFQKIRLLNYYSAQCKNLYGIEELLNDCPSAVSVNVVFPDVADVASDFKQPVSSYPNVKKLKIRNFMGTCKVYSYLMQVFPNLKEFFMHSNWKKKNRLQEFPFEDMMIVETAIETFNYLLPMPLFHINSIPMQDPSEFIKDVYDTTGKYKSLVVKYIEENIYNTMPFISAQKKTESKDKIVILLHCRQPKAFVPIGFIEKSGENLQSISLTLTMATSDEDDSESDEYESFLRAPQPKDSDYHFLDILKKCPNLTDIHIGKTTLHKYGNRSLPEKKSKFNSLRFSHCIIDLTFLPSLSSHVSYIRNFTLVNCGPFIDYNNYSIDMPHTEFHKVVFAPNFLDKTFFKVETMEDNKTDYYATDNYNGTYKKCEESEYKASLKREKFTSFYLRCRTFSSLRIKDMDFNFLLEKV
ncbi:hypothetical protein BD770DRAFT_406303 [Pilaira anomala]|nr:hypothetical protein BD770DRAFT_406303 [Pilaira anomala]